MSILPPRENNIEKATSTLQKSLNKAEQMCTLYYKALVSRKLYAKTASEFITKLKREGRVTKEELMEFFKPKKEKK